MTIQHYCPECDSEQSFSLMASEALQLGRKTKWWCEECGYELVRIGEDIDSTGRASA